jgi:hypothetical protein
MLKLGLGSFRIGNAEEGRNEAMAAATHVRKL